MAFRLSLAIQTYHDSIPPQPLFVQQRHPLAIHDVDPDSIDEERFITVQIGNSGLLLVVVYTMRGDAVRLTSARPETRQEAKAYEE